MKKLIKLIKDKSGTISVEFALISPMLLFSTMYSANMGVKVHEHQTLASATSAGTMYLQDYALQKDLSTLRPVYDKTTNDYRDSDAITAAKHVIRNSYGEDLPLESIQIETVCACQAPQSDSQGSYTDGAYDFKDDETVYYKKQTISYSRTGELCPYNCPETGGRARVLAEISIYHKTADFFSDDVVVAETVSTRLR